MSTIKMKLASQFLKKGDLVKNMDYLDWRGDKNGGSERYEVIYEYIGLDGFHEYDNRKKPMLFRLVSINGIPYDSSMDLCQYTTNPDRPSAKLSGFRYIALHWSQPKYFFNLVYHNMAYTDKDGNTQPIYSKLVNGEWVSFNRLIAEDWKKKQHKEKNSLA